MSSPRERLKEKREQFGLTMQAAGRLLEPAITGQTVKRFEEGAPVTPLLRDLCRAYMREAARLGYNPWEFHESVLCPAEFPAPIAKDKETLERILASTNGQPPATT